MIYLDNSATTALSPAVRVKMEEAADTFANPSSLHSAGLAAAKLLDEARQSVLASLGLKNRRDYRLIFTASGSEANNLLISGLLSAKNFRFVPRVVTTDSEHPSVLATLAAWEAKGVEVVKLSTRGGQISPEEAAEAVNERTVLFTVMAVNNETGARYDLKSLFALAKQKNPSVVTHTDAVQGFLKVPFAPAQTMVDAVTLSAHKIHAPKGTGALLVKQELLKAKRIAPLIYGGGQEEGLRSGTENVIGIAAFGEAAREGEAALPAFLKKAALLRAFFVEHLPPSVRVNEAAVQAPHIISLTLPGVRAETMLHSLSQEGICVSAGAACSSHKTHSNYVLPAFGLAPKEAEMTLRISLCRFTEEEELLIAANALKKGLETLIRA